MILVSLDHNFADDKEIAAHNILGVQKVRTAEPTPENLFPEMIVCLIPEVFSSNYGSVSTPDLIFRNIKEAQEYENVKKAAIEECKRLLYVGMTRAKDKLITATRKNVAWLKSIGIDAVVPGTEGEVDLCGTGIMSVIKQVPFNEEPATSDANAVTEHDMPASEDKEYVNKFIAPSRTGRTDIGKATFIASRGQRIPFKGEDELMNLVGDCIHNTYAACTGEKSHDVALAESLIRGFHFEKVLPDAEAVISSRQFLTDYLSRLGEKTAEYHELPFNDLSNGQIIRGSMDLVWETAEGCVLVDFKTYPGKISDVTDAAHKHYAGKYKPQFDCYRAALEAAGRKVLKSLVYYPISGTIVEIA